MTTFDREFFQVVDPESGYPLSLDPQTPNDFTNEEEAREAASAVALERKLPVTVIRLCRNEVTTYFPVTTVQERPPTP
jgi:hypothetical protein